ncbi:hypothetical protein EVAR_56095_1 [Eumeta japonica]|uniref:Uncharacterized protein n=1 Tax=Eumeta variegata TaxID=151549 RepID=A0A4C1YD40_EUMVA|nr:hypothetical protein EVAR_56095_1 [Eumeta japonica]
MKTNTERDSNADSDLDSFIDIEVRIRIGVGSTQKKKCTITVTRTKPPRPSHRPPRHEVVTSELLAGDAYSGATPTHPSAVRAHTARDERESRRDVASHNCIVDKSRLVKLPPPLRSAVTSTLFISMKH